MKSFLNTQTAPLQPEQGKALVVLLTEERFAKPLTPDEATRMGPIAMIVFHRLNPINVQIDCALALWISLLSEGNPARAVMWAYTIREIYITTKAHAANKIVTLNDWVLAFPDGAPTEAAFGEIWDAQKTLRGNGVDDSRNWTLPVPTQAAEAA